MLPLVILGCKSLPDLDHRTVSTARLDTHDTQLGQALEPLTQAHPGLAGIYPLRNARHAFAARVVLAHAAERTLDIQYYIWRHDRTGTMLFDAVRTAADRGIRVRLLLDDNNTSGLDGILAALDAHPQIEIRLFNPFLYRNLRVLDFITDFGRVNRRMHNKSFTIDNQVTIIGGRNVGDEYFGATDDMLFADLDVLAIGPVVKDVSRDFDRYWSSASSYPADRLLPPVDAAILAEIARKARELEQSPEAAAYIEAIRSLPFVQDLKEHRLPFEWAETRMVSDDPRKGLGQAPPDGLLPHRLMKVLGTPKAHVDLVSPYFVPTEDGVESFASLTEEGVQIRVLTNSFEATDVAFVHAGYARRRRALLKHEVKLYEFRGPPREPEQGSAFNPRGSSRTSLHAKTFATDGLRVFIGSFNFDPRSAKLNTEMGFVIESPILARQIKTVFDRDVPLNAYELALNAEGGLIWIERQGERRVEHTVEPNMNVWERLLVWLLAQLPIEWLL
ncbi:phospholipase D family protein [Oligoflexus tunisiensis]|uniref:phospholipase D family protein n=1 Tax=Oligoflexus tunisiensis TaxID=708132 RepID=UPI00159F188A|nr:phospholipase D family protein [Oligoflexus tunisiensis]